LLVREYSSGGNNKKLFDFPSIYCAFFHLADSLKKRT
jgi:hypothetical protein